MSEVDTIKRIVAPFVIHGIWKDEAEALLMLARDYVQKRVRRYHHRTEHFRSCYQTSVAQFAQQVAALCQGSERIAALSHLDRREQILRAEDDLEEWEVAEEFLARWQAVEADLLDASPA